MSCKKLKTGGLNKDLTLKGLSSICIYIKPMQQDQLLTPPPNT